MQPEVLSAKEVADLLSCTTRKVMRLARENKLRYVELLGTDAKSIRFPKDAILKLLDAESRETGGRQE